MADENKKRSGTESVSRAAFLRHSLKSTAGFLGTLADALFGDNLDGILRLFPTFIRPPGAIPEAGFLETCTRCGACAAACRFFAIKRVLTPGSFDEGTPYLLMRDTYCRLCNDLPCTTACQSGALLRSGPEVQPHIGLARIDAAACRRTSNEPCRLCIDACPERFNALSLPSDGASPSLSALRCTGCGACEAACPVRPEPAVTINPRTGS